MIGIACLVGLLIGLLFGWELWCCGRKDECSRIGSMVYHLLGKPDEWRPWGDDGLIHYDARIGVEHTFWSVRVVDTSNGHDVIPTTRADRERIGDVFGVILRRRAAEREAEAAARLEGRLKAAVEAK